MFRENFYDVLKALDAKVNVVVVPKNSGLKGYAWKVLKEAGFDLETAKKVSETKLEKDGLAVLLRRGEDIPRIVEDERRVGKFAVGITGDDLFDEYTLRNPNNILSVVNTYDWDDDGAEFGRPTLCLMSKTGKSPTEPAKATVGIASKYEYSGRLFLAKSGLVKGLLMDVQIYNGDVEEAVRRGYASMCIDTVYSGATRRQTGLGIVEKIRSSDLSVIAPVGGFLILEKLAKEIPLGPVIDRR
ncbi:hypothetical protein HYX08_02975 [Candidatus Woesearchaeota archaeon]|nr:hypothetical protein [Candidatus Woesearchaeota archaeon]